MKVPEEIRKVKRPVNTIVEDSGREGQNVILFVREAWLSMFLVRTPSLIMVR